MRKFLLLAYLLVCSQLAFADGRITSLSVDAGIVVFQTASNKQHSLPDCVDNANQQAWSISITSQSGRAVYSLLISAMSLNIPIKVESADDCLLINNVERAQRVWFAR